MNRKTTLRAPMPLADEALTAVAGAKGGKYPKLSFKGSPVTNIQTNLSGPIVQLAAGNGGDVTQFAAVAQSNSISF